SPTPLFVHRPQRHVGKDDNRRTVTERGQVLLQPFELFLTQNSQAAGFEIGHIHQAYEVYSLLIETLPAQSLRPFTEALQVKFPVIGEDIMFTGDVKNAADLCALEHLGDRT